MNKRFEKLETSLFGSAPVYIFMDKEKEQEWKDLDPEEKKFVMNNLKKNCLKNGM